MSISVAVLGAGPSGLAAAHAAAAFNEVTIYSRTKFQDPLMNRKVGWEPVKSELYGAQYLHEPLPGIDCGLSSNLAVQFIGNAQGYSDKVYGKDYRGPVSPAQFEKDHPAWDIRKAYDDLWSFYSDRIVGAEFDRYNFPDVVSDLRQNHNLIISAIPRRLVCINPEHEFKSQMVYAIGDAPALGVRNPIHCEPDTLVYNGSPDYGWYRKAKIFGHSTAEWPQNPDRPKPPITGLVSVEKPLSTTCDCWVNKGVRFLGRYGAWKKGILVHHVFRAAVGAVADAMQGEQGALF